MRLLHVEDLTFKRFETGQQPPYAILSHRWGGSEARLADLQRQRETAPEVLAKVKGFARYVKAHLPDIKWIWVDSCCINQDSAAELSEGVNRMFSWYRSSRVCIAYLPDVKDPSDRDVFRKSVWFTRGWTLQEMVASKNMIFLTNKWQVIGHKGRVGHLRLQAGTNLEPMLSEITGVPREVLDDINFSSVMSMDTIFHWMDGRDTLKEEDMIYALFGIFGVAPGANYGEGTLNARERLMDALERKAMRKSKDASMDLFRQAIASSPPLETPRRKEDLPEALPRQLFQYFNDHFIHGTASGWTLIEGLDLGAQKPARFEATYPGDLKTKLGLVWPSEHGKMRADWSVLSQSSTYYPGRHEGHLVFHDEVPFREPAIYWDTPLLSLYPLEGRLRADLGKSWSPSDPKMLLDIVEAMAVVVLSHPRHKLKLGAEHYSKPSLPFGLHRINRYLPSKMAYIPGFLGSFLAKVSFLRGTMEILHGRVQFYSIDDESLQLCTQFFCRAYTTDHTSLEDWNNDLDLDFFYNITHDHRTGSTKAIACFIKHFLVNYNCGKPPFFVDGQSSRECFAQVTTVGEWRRAERRWADMLNEESGGLISQGRDLHGRERPGNDEWYDMSRVSREGVHKPAAISTQRCWHPYAWEGTSREGINHTQRSWYPSSYHWAEPSKKIRRKHKLRS